MWGQLPTPRAEKHTPQSRADFTPNLAARIQMLGTPTSHERNQSPRQVDHGVQLANQVGENLGLKLQPAFVEWMMGWPIGWTDLRPLAMGKSACAPQLHGKSFQKWLDIMTVMLETITNGGFQYERESKQDLP
jgi:hypothetical protein